MPNPSLNIAITGGTGFVGRYVIEQALARGHKVKALVRNPGKVRDLDHENLSWVKGGLGDVDAELVKDADVLIHIAGLIKAQKKSQFYAVNADAAGALARAAEAKGVKRVVLLSSQAASQPHLSAYAGSKRAGEDKVKTGFDGPVAIIRSPAVFGPGDQATAPFFRLLDRGMLPVPGGRGWKTRRLSMIYVKDLAVEIVRAAETGEYDGEVVTPASLNDMSWLDFAGLCSKAFGKRITVTPMPMLLLYPVAGVTSITSRLFGKGHLTLEKLKEFKHADWSTETLISDATPPIEALKTTMATYVGSSEISD